MKKPNELFNTIIENIRKDKANKELNWGPKAPPIEQTTEDQTILSPEGYKIATGDGKELLSKEEFEMLSENDRLGLDPTGAKIDDSGEPIIDQADLDKIKADLETSQDTNEQNPHIETPTNQIEQ